jgi:hypothetical protein
MYSTYGHGATGLPVAACTDMGGCFLAWLGLTAPLSRLSLLREARRKLSQVQRQEEEVRFAAMREVWWGGGGRELIGVARQRGDGARRGRGRSGGMGDGWSGRGGWAALCLLGRFFFLCITVLIRWVVLEEQPN